jgi:rhodanese-related sulfurtransferase
MYNYFKLSLILSAALFIAGPGQAQANSPVVPVDTASEAVQNKSDDFPGRKTYAHVPYITIEQLFSEYDNIVIVDARSAFEYETLRILSAVNIPLSLNNSEFTEKLQTLRDKNPGKKIVFYCNGHTCMKSYKATHRAKVIAKIDNVYAFDAGIFDWTKAYPEKAVLLDQTPVDTSKLISKTKYKQHMLPALDFINQADKNTIILDVRSRHQREGFYVFSGVENIVSMANKKQLKQYIEQAKKENKKLFIYDAVGKQVRWLQYYLEQQNAGTYYFMQGGAVAFYEIPNSKLVNN